LADLRAMKKPSAEMGTLRAEVLALQKENRELRKEFDDLKKKIEALPGPSTTKTNKPASSRKSFRR
jgi:regulator of replication initiation timing